MTAQGSHRMWCQARKQLVLMWIQTKTTSTLLTLLIGSFLKMKSALFCYTTSKLETQLQVLIPLKIR